MKPFARIMLLALAFALLAALVGVFATPSGRSAASTVLNVFVANPAGSPVPVTGNVALSGTPNVNATISGMPTVNLAPGASVNVASTPSTPVFTRDKDNPALTPFQTTLCSAIGGSICSFPDSFTVPATQRFVIEFVAEVCGTGISGSAVDSAQLTTIAGGSFVFYNFAPGPVNSFGNSFSNQQVRIYADPGTTVKLRLLGTGTPLCDTMLSGYLVTP